MLFSHRWNLWLWAALLVGASVALEADARDVPFSGRKTIAMASPYFKSYETALADVDGDGDMDVVGAAFWWDRVTWWENTAGDGSVWTEHAISTTFDVAWDVNAIDLDQDGDMDVLATGSSGGGLTWWENTNGDGSAWTDHPIVSGAAIIEYCDAGDVDGDGDLDVAYSNRTSGRMYFMENTSGDALAWTSHQAGDGLADVQGLDLADVDGDGDLDMMVGSRDGDRLEWRENADGLGTSWISHIVATNYDQPKQIVCVDMDGDGDMDAITPARDGDEVAWFENVDGIGTVWSKQTVVGSLNDPYAADVLDMDMDGDQDVVVVSATTDLVVYYENALSSGGGWIAHQIDNSFAGGASVHLGDLDGDGDPDIIGAAGDASLFAWYENLTIHHNAVFPQQSLLVNGSSVAVPYFVNTGDIDGDGKLDVLAALHDADQIVWYRNTDGAGTFTASKQITNLANGATCVESYDLDRDGDLDVLACSRMDGETAWYENLDGAGTFGPQRVISPDSSWTHATTADDLDGDGDLDVVVINGHPTPTGFVAWHANDGSGNFGTENMIESNLAEPVDVRTGDLDGDGSPDVVVACALGDEVVWFQNDGSGGFGSKQVVTTTQDLPSGVRLADIDADGDLDVAVASKYDQTLAWYENDGSGSFTRHVVLTGLGYRGNPELVDLDTDGDIDVVVAGGGSELVWFPNLGGGSFGVPQVVSTAPSGLDRVAAADIDGDGLVDVLSASYNDHKVAWYRNRGGQFGTDTTDTAPASLHDGQTADVLTIVARHNGRASDSPVEMVSLEFLFEESVGDPLSEAEANSIIDSASIYLDDGDGALDTGVDTLVSQVSTLAWNASGTQTIVLNGGAVANARVDYGTSNTYFLAVTLTPSAFSEPVDQFRVTHVTNPDGGGIIAQARDLTYHVPLTMEHTLDVPSSIVAIELRVLTAPVMQAEPAFTSGTANTVYWAASDVATAYQVQCATDAGFSSIVYDVSLAPSILEVTFDPLDDGGTYFFRALAWNTSSASSPWSNVVSSQQDATSPTGTVEIDGGATYASSLNVTLDLTWLDPNPSSTLSPNPSGSGVRDMRFSNLGDLVWGAWTPVAATAPWTLYDADGTRTVYAQFRDNAGNVSDGMAFDTITLDRTGPTVTVEQAATQADPTDTVPIYFDVVFSEPVRDFTASDVSMGGNAGATATWTILTSTPFRYQIRVDSVGVGGLIIPSIPAGVAFDMPGNPNQASTSVDNEVTFYGAVQLVSPAPLGGGLFGFSLTGIGDLNGDGHGDAVVGAYNEHFGGASTVEHVGRVHVYDASALTCTLLYTIDSPRIQANGAFGYSVADMADVTGDGVDDLIVGAYRHDSTGNSEAGAVYLFNGATGGLIATLRSPNDQIFGYFGFSVDAVPNAYGSGYPGVAVGAPGETDPDSPPHAGRAYLFYTTDGATWDSVTIVSTDEQKDGYFGYAVAGVEDMDGDSGGMIIGATGENLAYQFIPGSLGPALAAKDPRKGESRLLPVDAAGFGCCISGVPDADGDGGGDVIIGARAAYDSGGPIYSGRAYLYNGRTRVLIRTMKSPNEQAYGFYGHAVAGIEDCNGNGRGDLVVGAMSEAVGSNTFAGRAYVYDGGTGELLYSLQSPVAQYDGRYGCAISGVPEPTPDGLRDLIVGAYNEDAVGYAYIQSLPVPESPWLTGAKHWELYR